MLYHNSPILIWPFQFLTQSKNRKDGNPAYDVLFHKANQVLYQSKNLSHPNEFFVSFSPFGTGVSVKTFDIYIYGHSL